MNKENRKYIEEIIVKKIIEGMRCPKDFICTKSGVKQLCRAKDIEEEMCLECLEENSLDCPFVIDIEYTRLCCCPLRIYIAKILKK